MVSMLLILCLYNSSLVIARLSIGDIPIFIRRIVYGVLLLILRLYVIKHFWICSIFLQDSLEMLQSAQTSHPYKITRVTKVLKEDLLFIPHHKVFFFTIIFKTKISFPPSVNPTLNAIVLVELVMNINS